MGCCWPALKLLCVISLVLQHKSMERNSRKRLARFLSDRYAPNDQRFSEVAWQHWQAMDDQKLLECITHPEAFQMCVLQPPNHASYGDPMPGVAAAAAAAAAGSGVNSTARTS